MTWLKAREICQELLRLQEENKVSILDMDLDGYSLFHVSLWLGG
jgi:hypothetical protein